MTKRKAATTARCAMRRSKRSKTSTSQAFVWNPHEWKQTSQMTSDVSVLVKIGDRERKVVKKVLELNGNSDDDTFPLEVQAIAMIQACNRIVRPIHYASNAPDEKHGTAYFEHHALGDVRQWKEAGFDAKNHKPVPESYIWRFFLQMSQALAVLQLLIGPNQEERNVLLHRDIKPNNILVVDNGTTYPSFALHDFGCAATYTRSRARRPAICGTMEWQPPENPIINTKAAEVWALGACVHYLATGGYPIQDKVAYGAACLAKYGSHPDASHDYPSPERYYAARVPRKVTPINLDHRQQRNHRIAPYLINGQKYFNHEYSDELDSWMKKCLSIAPSGRPTVKQLLNNMGPVAIGMLKKMGGKAALYDMDATFDEDL
jgi:serine/threonine protein kinase